MSTSRCLNRLAEHRLHAGACADLGYPDRPRVNIFLVVMATAPSTPAYFILRHDITTASYACCHGWEIDRSLGVKGSYFFRLSTIDIDLMHAIDDGGELGQAITSRNSPLYRPAAASAAATTRRAASPRRRTCSAAIWTSCATYSACPCGWWPPTATSSTASSASPTGRSWSTATSGKRLTFDFVDDDAFMWHVTSRHSDAGHLGLRFPDYAAKANRPRLARLTLACRPAPSGVSICRVNIRDDVRRLRRLLRYGTRPRLHLPVDHVTGTSPDRAHQLHAAGDRRIQESRRPQHRRLGQRRPRHMRMSKAPRRCPGHVAERDRPPGSSPIGSAWTSSCSWDASRRLRSASR